ncbi:DUF5347 family protein [Providencia manganoxydans]|uniref:DUF5347 family protein n=1 Tax=Providencia manganoxydans TaxID=2923283 RepID=UPI0032D9EADE
MNSSTTEQSKAQGIIQLLGNIKNYESTGQSLAERTEGLNQASRVRTSLFHQNKDDPDNRELAGFIEYLRLNDERALSMIFYLSGIKSNQHQLSFDEFNKEEKQLIITAINQIKALAALLPKNIAMPI